MSAHITTRIPRPSLINSDEITAMQEELMCTLCHDIPMEVPWVSKNCQHAFCKGCILEALSYKQECPVCREMLTERVLEPISGLARRIWEQVGVRCQDCGWTGKIGNFLPHHMKDCVVAKAGSEEPMIHRVEAKLITTMVELKFLRIEHDKLNEKIGEVREERDDLKSKCDRQHECIKLLVNCLTLDPTYQYNRDNIVKLTQLICVHLEDKPQDIDRNRIFNCVKSCYDAINYEWSHKPAHYETDARMLINVCLATAGWFTTNQIDRLRTWAIERGWQ